MTNRVHTEDLPVYTHESVTAAATASLAEWNACRRQTDDWPNEWYISMASRLAENLRQAMDILDAGQVKVERIQALAVDARRDARQAADPDTSEAEWERLRGCSDGLDAAVDVLVETTAVGR